MESTATPQQYQVVTDPTHIEESMWSTFQNILTFISLAFFAGSLHALWDIFVNQWILTTENVYSRLINSYLLNYSIATLVVSAPIFILLFINTNKKYIQQPELKKSRSKKTINYVILIITFIVLIVRTVNAITTALNNSFSVNFGFHLLITFVISGIIFVYYLYEVRIEKQTSPLSKYIIGSIVIFLLSIVTLITGLSIRNDVKQKSQKLNRRATSSVPFQEGYPAVIDKSEKKIRAIATNLPSPKQTIQGIDFSIENAQIYEFVDQTILELNLIFASTTPCPLTGGAVCGVNQLGIQGTDESGFKLERTLLNNSETIKDNILRQGEKVKGKYFFKLDEISKKYVITYNTSSGELSDKVEILMMLK